MDTNAWVVIGTGVTGFFTALGLYIKNHRPVAVMNKLNHLGASVDELKTNQFHSVGKIQDLVEKISEVSDVATRALDVAEKVRLDALDIRKEQSNHLIESAAGFGRIGTLESQIANLVELHTLSEQRATRERLEVLQQLTRMEERSEIRIREFKDDMKVQFQQLHSRSDSMNLRLDTLAERRNPPRI